MIHTLKKANNYTAFFFHGREMELCNGDLVYNKLMGEVGEVIEEFDVEVRICFFSGVCETFTKDGKYKGYHTRSPLTIVKENE